jgi:N6-L-threonylcarbamoyladenine synthase
VKLSRLLPHLGLIVSGGNTLLCALDEGRRVSVLSSTRDDAAGEALDKGAKLLGLGYPGGPWIEREAARGRSDAYDFPRGIGRRDELDFSFSGLKTSLRYLLEKMSTEEIAARRADLCASYQEAVVDALARKTRAALQQGGGRFRSLGLSGGVANNGVLRAALDREAGRAGIPFLPAQPRHTGDNAGMIAFAAWTTPATAAASAGLDLRIEPGAGLA